MPIRDEAINVFMGLPGDGDRLELTYNHGVDSYELGTGYNHIALTVADLDSRAGGAGGEGHRPGEAAVPRARGRLADLLRARPRRLSRRADRARLTRRGPRAGPVLQLLAGTAVPFSGWSSGSPSSTSDRTRSASSSSRTRTTGGSAPTRSTSRCASASTRRPAGRCSPSRWSGRSRRSSCSRTSAARPGSSGSARSRPRRSARRPTARSSCAPRASAPGLDVEVLSRERGGALRLPRGRQLDDAERRRRARHRRRLDAAHARARTGSPATRARGGSAPSSRPSASSTRSASSRSTSRRCASTCARSSREAPWLADADGRIAGIGGTVRNLGAALMLDAGLPSYGVQGFCIEIEALDALVERLAAMTPKERRGVAGIKAERADLILAGAVVVQTVMEAGGFERLEVTEAGLREGAFFEERLGRRPAAAGGRARRVGPQPRRPVPPRDRAHRPRRAARAGDLGRARRERRAPRRPRRARAAVGRRRCCTTSARPSTTTTTTSTRAT